jgi:hypothetical protein
MLSEKESESPAILTHTYTHTHFVVREGGHVLLALFCSYVVGEGVRDRIGVLLCCRKYKVGKSGGLDNAAVQSPYC